MDLLPLPPGESWSESTAGTEGATGKQSLSRNVISMRKAIESIAGIGFSCLLLSALLSACDEEPLPTTTPQPTNTSTPLATPAPRPFAALTPMATPTHTSIPAPTATPMPVPTATPMLVPTATPMPVPTATPVPVPTATPVPVPTATPAPGSHDAVNAMPWLADGITKWEGPRGQLATSHIFC